MGVGFWYIYPIEPLGPSNKLNLLEAWEASKTRLLDCDNNVAHSNDQIGFEMDEHLDEDNTVQQTNDYQPLEDPKNSTSRKLDININRITGYKNRRSNIWLEGGYIRLTRSSSADSATGISIFNTAHRDKDGRCTESVIVGDSENIGEPVSWRGVDYPRSLPYYKVADYPRQGFQFYKGPQYAEDVYFAGFNNNPYFNTGALSWAHSNSYFTAVYSSVKNALFNFDDSAKDGNRIYQGVVGDMKYKNFDGDISASLYDWDNDVLVVRQDPFTVTDGCTSRPNWNMATCTEKYGKVRVQIEKTDTTAIMVRDDLPSAQMEFTLQNGFSGYPVRLGGNFSYTLAWSKDIPRVVVLESDGIEKDGWVRVGMCIPRDAEYEIRQLYGVHRLTEPSDWTYVDSLEELDKVDDKIGEKVYHDTENGVIYFVLHNPYPRAANETKNCPLGLCPIIKFTLEGGDASDADCRSRIYTADQMKLEPETIPENTDVIPKNADSPPPTWGAGPTRPFPNRQPANGVSSVM